MPDIVVRASGLWKSYETGGVSNSVLRGINLAVIRTECLFLAGPSGSGKTTLLSILGCLLSADSGALEILGEDVLGYSTRQQARFRREKIGFVFQRHHLFDTLTAVENVRVPFDLLGWPAHRSQSRALGLLSKVGLASRASRPVQQLSMGQRQRVAIARALAGDPDLILADEPTASLDAESGLSAMRLLRELCKEFGKTAIVVTHDARIYSLADRVLRVVDGRIGNAIPAPASAHRNRGVHVAADRETLSQLP